MAGLRGLVLQTVRVNFTSTHSLFNYTSADYEIEGFFKKKLKKKRLHPCCPSSAGWRGNQEICRAANGGRSSTAGIFSQAGSAPLSAFSNNVHDKTNFYFPRWCESGTKFKNPVPISCDKLIDLLRSEKKNGCV